LIHVPEERIPSDLGSISSTGGSRSGARGKGAVSVVTKPARRAVVNTAAMTDVQKVEHWLEGLGFDAPDCKVAVAQVGRSFSHICAMSIYLTYVL